MKVEADKYYAIFYQRKFYIGRVLEIMDDDSCEITFLFTKGTNSWEWPKRRDIDIVPMEDIICGPIILLGHGPFSLSPDDIKNIEEKYKQM